MIGNTCHKDKWQNSLHSIHSRRKHPVKPVRNGPVLSSHPLLSCQFSNSQFLTYANAVLVICIRWPPLSSSCSHPVAVLCMSFFVIFTSIKRPPLNGNWATSFCKVFYCVQNVIHLHYLTIRLRARVFYEQIVNKAQPSWLLLVENEGE